MNFGKALKLMIKGKKVYAKTQTYDGYFKLSTDGKSVINKEGKICSLTGWFMDHDDWKEYKEKKTLSNEIHDWESNPGEDYVHESKLVNSIKELKEKMRTIKIGIFSDDNRKNQDNFIELIDKVFGKKLSKEEK